MAESVKTVKKTRRKKLKETEIPAAITKMARAKLLKSDDHGLENNEIDTSFTPWDKQNPLGIHTVSELVEGLKSKKHNIEIEAVVLGYDKKEKKMVRAKMNKTQFLESLDGRKDSAKKKVLKEHGDVFATATADQATASIVGGPDFIPLLGGPFFKQLYIHDYQKMHNTAFYAYHHDPLAIATTHITRDFTLGRGWRVDVKGKDKDQALVMWRAFEDVNKLYELMEYLSIELSVYGEIMLWKLPDNQSKITYNLSGRQKVPKGLIPRVRLVDPSVIWEIVTYPEDITRVLYYQWVSPTQYQTYTGRDQGDGVPSTKFIFQQIPGDEIIHKKINCVSNEKRGRSDYFPVMGYMKRLRDSVNYSVIGLQKSAAWSLDTEIDGSQEDIDAYVEAQNELGDIPTAGSEFVHTPAVKREYLSNSAVGKGGSSDAFDWCLSMIASGTGIPMQYFGTHLSGGGTRASALVATEPVAKKFENRQLKYEQILQELSSWLFKKFDLNAEIEVTFPEVVVQDRTAKLADLQLAETNGWVSRETCATIAAKELGITEYEYEEEQEKIAKSLKQNPNLTNPLTQPGLTIDEIPSEEETAGVDQHSITGEERSDARRNRGF